MNVALILAGGIGSRLGGDVPKQYIDVCGYPVISYALEVFDSHKDIDKIQIVAHEKWHDFISRYSGSKFAGFSKPGENRQLSILNGLEDIKKYAGEDCNVIIHDAARPLVKAKTVSEILNKLEKFQAVTPVLRMKDTIYSCVDNRFVKVLNRDEVVAGQAPEGFKLLPYYNANRALSAEQMMKVTGSMQVAIEGGLETYSIEGDEDNIKITTWSDLDRFEKIMIDRRRNLGRYA